MNNISARQNEEHSIHKLAAARQIYSEVKFRLKILRFLSVYLCVVLAFISLALSNDMIIGYIGLDEKVEMSGPVAIFGAILAIAELIMLASISSSKEHAAKIQEDFDCYTFGMVWNDIAVGQKPSNSQIFDYSEKHKKNIKSINKLADWYNPLTSTVDECVGTLLCQGMNLEWDQSLRLKLQNQIAITSMVGLFLILVPNIFIDLSVNSILINVFCPLLPFIIFNIALYQGNKSSIESINHCLEVFHEIWDKIVAKSISPNEIRKKNRELQNLIFNHRKTSYAIDDNLYWKYKNKNEASAKYSIEKMIKQIT